MCLGDISVRSLAAHSTGVFPHRATYSLYNFFLTVLMAVQAQASPTKRPHTKVQRRCT